MLKISFASIKYLIPMEKRLMVSSFREIEGCGEILVGSTLNND